ncbi:hypothetical protein ACFL1Y_02060 [Patescibacteria group bacterium]
MLLPKKFYSFIEKTLVIALIIVVLEFSLPQIVNASEIQDSNNIGPVAIVLSTNNIMSIQPDINSLPEIENKTPKMVRWVTVTAYSSTVDQCDDSPFITANGKWVYDGLVAANFLYFGTKIKIPDYFGNKIFTVDDRMNKKYNSRVDVWFATREQAKQFGVRYLKIEVY